MTYNQEFILNNVIHIHDIHNNLVYGPLLNKNCLKLALLFNKFVLLKKNMCVGKSYLSDSLFKLNVLIVVLKMLTTIKYLLWLIWLSYSFGMVD